MEDFFTRRRQIEQLQAARLTKGGAGLLQLPATTSPRRTGGGGFDRLLQPTNGDKSRPSDAAAVQFQPTNG